MKYKYFLEKLLIDFSDYHLIHDEKSYKQFKKNKKSNSITAIGHSAPRKNI